MTAGPTHSHAHGAVAVTSAGMKHRGRLVAVLAITLATLVVEVVGGILSGSLALMADAGHLLTDAIATTVALVAVTVANRPAPARRSYGNFRAEILGALVNGTLLLVVCAVVLVEAVRRLLHPGVVDGGPMILLGAVALVANAVSLRLLREGQAESLNVRGAYLEVLGDLLGSAAVVVAGVVVLVAGWVRADAVASLLIAALIAPRAFALLREAVHVLAEGAPRGLDLEQLRAHLAAVPGVVDVHDLHVWTITSGMPVLSAHVVVSDAVVTAGGCGDGSVLDRLAACVGDHFDVEHSTFQIEPAGHVAHEPTPPHE
jgi:cobalt-zinc-cadmium efflux system protein